MPSWLSRMVLHSSLPSLGMLETHHRVGNASISFGVDRDAQDLVYVKHRKCCNSDLLLAGPAAGRHGHRHRIADAGMCHPMASRRKALELGWRPLLLLAQLAVAPPLAA